MFSWDHYVPILKWKQGEQAALRGLTPDIKMHITPLLELQPPAYDVDTGEPTKPLNETLTSAVSVITSCWNDARPIFIDCHEIASECTLDGVYAPHCVYQETTKHGIRFIPVTGIQRSMVEVNAAIRHSANGLCIRLTLDDLENPNLSTALSDFRNVSKLPHDQLDLLLDLGDIINTDTRLLQRAVIDYVATIPEIEHWRTLTLAACAFPQSMQGIPKKITTSICRSDWALWTQLHAKLPRKPAFGDYCIQHPDLTDFDPKTMQASATIRYTSDTDWLLVRGQGLRTPGAGGFTQFLQLSQNLMSETEYSGPHHCAGCRMIYDKAQPDNKSPGNLTTWREIGTNHHITLVVEQIKSLSGTSESDLQLA